MERVEVGAYEYHDKIPLKKNLDEQGVRVVPPGTVRYGAHLEPGAILMPGYVNIGAYVGAGSMVDTWATVGSCAQVGKGVYISRAASASAVSSSPRVRSRSSSRTAPFSAPDRSSLRAHGSAKKRYSEPTS